MDTTSGVNTGSERPEEVSLAARSRIDAPATPPWRRSALSTAADLSVAQRRFEETHPTFTDMPIGSLFGELFDEMNTLVRKEVDLARAELRSNVEDGIRTIKWFSVAGLCAGSAMTLLLMAIVFALAEKVPGWAVALILAGVLLVIGLIAGIVAWRGRLRTFLAATQRSLKGNMQWKHEI